MKRINYKGRCEKRKASKCTEVCRTYSKIQSAYVDPVAQIVANELENFYSMLSETEESTKE